MQNPQHAIVVCVATCILAGGCAATGMKNPFAARNAKPGEKIASKGKSSKSSGSSARTKSRSSSAKSKKSEPKTTDVAAETANSERKSAGATGVGDAPAKPFDDLTQALVDAELRDASTEEREKVLAELKDVPADLVPRILSTRRAALEFAKTQAQPGDPAGATRRDSQVQPASGVAGASTGVDQNAQAAAAYQSLLGALGG